MTSNAPDATSGSSTALPRNAQVSVSVDEGLAHILSAMEYEARAVGLRPTREGNLQINGVELPVDPDKLGRRFFECACGRLCRFVYLPGLKCRRCTGLEHSCRHVWRTVPGLHRIVKLRKGLARRYGCAISLEPFTAIPRKKRHCVRYARIVDEIRELELGLVNYLAGINRTLTRRLELRT